MEQSKQEKRNLNNREKIIKIIENKQILFRIDILLGICVYVYI